MGVQEIPSDRGLGVDLLLHHALAIDEQGEFISLIPFQDLLSLQGFLTQSCKHHCLRHLLVELPFFLVEEFHILGGVKLERITMRIFRGLHDLLNEGAVIVEGHQHEVEEVLLYPVHQLQPLFLSRLVLLALQLLLGELEFGEFIVDPSVDAFGKVNDSVLLALFDDDLLVQIYYHFP